MVPHCFEGIIYEKRLLLFARETVRETPVKRDRVSLLAGGNGAYMASTVSKL